MQKIGFELLVGCMHPAPAGYGNKVKSGQKFRLVKAVYLPKAAANSIALYRIAQLGADGYAQAVIKKIIFPIVQYHMFGRKAFTPAVYAPKFKIFL